MIGYECCGTIGTAKANSISDCYQNTRYVPEKLWLIEMGERERRKRRNDHNNLAFSIFILETRVNILSKIIRDKSKTLKFI